MSSKRRGKKKNRADEQVSYIKQVRLTDIIAYIYLLLVFAVYPVITDNKYFNITITRYHFYIFVAGLYITLCLLAYLIEYYQAKYYRYPSLISGTEVKARWKHPDFWMTAFLCAQVFAWLCAADKEAAWKGNQGRFMGLLMYVLLAATFLLLSKRLHCKGYIYMLLMLASSYSYIIAIGQYMENDFMGYKDKISPKQYDTFISTFGNINIFACFLSISIPAFMAILIFAEKLWYRIVAGLVLTLAGVCILVANSDSVFLGLFATVVLLFFLSYWRGHVRRLFVALSCLATGNLVLALITKYAHTRFDRKRGGLALALNRLDVAVFCVVACLLLLLILCVIRKLWGQKVEQWNKKKVMLLFAVGGILCMIAGVMVGIHMESSYFVFNDKWGSYRGFIWKKVVSAYQDAPVINKIFGYGNESVRVIMKDYCYDEMIKVTGKVYDNAHNELLQYLLTTGIVGMVSYIGLFVSSIIYMLKYAKGNMVAYVSVTVAVSYFVQGILNLNQPITTPFYFVFLAMGIGSVNYRKRLEEVESYD